MLFFLIQMSYALNLDCNPNTCEADSIGNEICSPSCMIEPCNYDSWADTSYDKIGRMIRSDCYHFCVSSNCTYGLLENDRCDDGKIYTECNIQECGWDLGQCGFCAKNCYENMLGDGKCNEECNIAECRYDWNDCNICAKNCYEYMLGDGNCDEECNVSECRYDLNDCGRCAEGCKLELINNGICNPECYNVDCEYDGKDCGCAPNCRLEDYGKCKSECMVPDCNYDSITTPCIYEDLREFHKYWQLLNYDFSITRNIDFLDCFSNYNENFINCEIFNLYEIGELIRDDCGDGCLKCTDNSTCVDCDYSKGYLNYFDACVKRCPEGYSSHNLVPSICYRNQESVKIYVDYTTTKDILNGSQEYPYKTLYEAINKTETPFIEILLKPGIHEIDYKIPLNYMIISMTIKSDCNTNCAEYAFLNITNSLFSFPTAGVLSITLLNLIIDRKSVDNSYMIYATDINDSGCPQLDILDLIEITAKSKLYVENVTFQNIEYNVRSIINAEDCRIELHNTNFFNIRAFNCLGQFSVIMLKGDISLITSFLYEEGNVSLNNIYHSKLISFGSSFIASNGFNNIKVTGVEFQNIEVLNLWGISGLWDSCKSLFCIDDCKQVVFTNNKFNSIYTQYYVFDISLRLGDVDWASCAIVNNNHLDYLWSNDLAHFEVYDEASYISIENLNIFQSLLDSDIIYIYGRNWDTEVMINNISIKNSSFYTIIELYHTKILDISCIYTENLISRGEDLKIHHKIYKIFDWSTLNSMHNSPYSYLSKFISAYDGVVSISNITVNTTSFSYDFDPHFSFVKISNSSNLLLKNIRINDVYNTLDYFIDISHCKEIYMHNIFLKNPSKYSYSVFDLKENLNIAIFSSYFNFSKIEISTDNNTFFEIYDTIFDNGWLELSGLSKESYYQLINCSFFNASYGSEGVIATSNFHGNNKILTKNCIFKFNSCYLLYFEGGNYQDINSIFELNDKGFHFEHKELTNTYLFNGSKFYDNKYSFIEAEDGIMNFTDCIFLRNGEISTESSLFIINSTFLNVTTYWNPWIEAKGNQSYIINSYFYNYDGINFINSSSPSFEIYNSIFITENYWGYDRIIGVQGSGSLTISNINFIISSRQSIIYVDGERNTKIENSYFNVNQAYELGSIVIKGGSLIMSNITMKIRNKIDNYDDDFDLPFIYANNSNVIDIEDSRFDELFALYLENTDLIKISRSSFKNAQKDQAVKISNYNESYLTDLEFISNINNDIGGSVYIINDLSGAYMIIDNCTFNENQADFGGAIVIDGCEVTITNSKFFNNTARIGGAIVSSCWNVNLTNYLINNIFNNNSADIGGAVYWEGIYQDISNNTFIDNHALYGDITASQPVKLGIIQPPHRLLEESKSLENNLVCSFDHNISFQAAFIDSENQVISYNDYDNYSATVTCESSNIQMVGNTEEYSDSGVFSFSGLKFLCSPGSEIVLNLSCPGKFNNYFHDDKTYELPSTIITIKTRNCEKGEYNNVEKCEYCKEGTYSLDPNNSCEACPKNAYCYGGNQIAPEKGYWHGNIDSSIIYPCPNPDACLGGINKEIKNISLVGLCSEGYRGNLCQPCDFHYSSSGRNKCEKCPANQATNATKIISISIAAIAALAGIVYFTLKTAYEPKSTMSIYFRILINYLQMITLVARLKLNWPFYIDYWLTNQGYPGEVPTHIVSIDCYLMDESDPDSYKTVYFKKMIFIVVLPAFLGISAFIFWSFIAVFKWNIKMMKNELIATLCIILFLILPSITDYMFSIYSCTNIYNELYLVSNLDIKCWEGDHLYYALAVALPGIIVWTIGIPACVFLYLWKKQFKLHKRGTRLRFGFLYNGYHEITYYWEFIVMLRKLMVICSTVFLTTATITTQTASCASIFAVFYFIQYRYYPFEYENLNKSELGSNFVILITTWCGLFYTDSTPNRFANIFFFFCILSSNAYFVFMWTRMMIIELKLLAIELFPYFKNYFDESDLKLKKTNEMKPIFSLYNQVEESEIEIEPETKIMNSVGISIVRMKENMKKIEEEKDIENTESSGELSVYEVFDNKNLEKSIQKD